MGLRWESPMAGVAFSRPVVGRGEARRRPMFRPRRKLELELRPGMRDEKSDVKRRLRVKWRAVGRLGYRMGLVLVLVAAARLDATGLWIVGLVGFIFLPFVEEHVLYSRPHRKCGD